MARPAFPSDRPDIMSDFRCSRRAAIATAALGCMAVPGRPVFAQEDEFLENLTEETRRAYSRVVVALEDLDGYLTAIRFHQTAIIGLNFFALSVGGIDSIRDLEEGRGVDPETLAALHAGFAIPEVARHLNIDRDQTDSPTPRITSADGRLRYKGTVVRLYAPSRLRELFKLRERFRIDDDQRRNEAFFDFAARRRRAVGVLVDVTGQGSEPRELSERYRDLQPRLLELENSLRNSGANSILGAADAAGQHYFGYSVAGINVQEDLTKGAVDPETYAAIIARNVSIDVADSFTYSQGRIIYDEDINIRMYSPETLTRLFERRDRLTSS